MPRPVSPSIPEKEFVREALAQGLRVDGRAPLEMRQPVLSFGTEFGYVECALGKTKVLCAIDAAMVRPQPERPFEGIISIHAEISPMASTEYEPGYGRPSDQEVEITRMLDKILKRSDAIDKEALCVLAGQRVWHLRLTFHFLSDGGNQLDCACLAGITALRHFRRPEVEVIGDDEVIIHAPEERAPLPLAIHHTPLCISFALFDNSLPSLLDPTYLEETLCAGTMSIALNAQKELCVVQKAGGVAMEPDAILQLLEVGVMKVKELDSLVEEALAADFSTRVVEVR